MKESPNIGDSLSHAVDKIAAKLPRPKRESVFHDDRGNEVKPSWVLGIQSLFAVSTEGVVSANSISYRTDGLVFPLPPAGVSSQAREIVLATGNDDLVFTPGAGVILGEPDKGKSLFANTLKARNPDRVAVIRYREPETDSLLYEQQLVGALHASIQSADFIFVDSLRTAFYASGGSTGKGGVNMGLFELLTAYDLLAKAWNKVICFALNPMTTDQDAITYYLEATRGSVSHTFHAIAPKAFRLSSRSARSRAFRDYKYTPTTDQNQQNTVAATLRSGGRSALAVTEEQGIADLYTFPAIKE